MKTSAWRTVCCAGLLFVGALRADAEMARMCDITGNGTVSSLDAIYVLQFVAGMRDLTPDQQLLADASGNGKVTTFDAARILQASAGRVLPGSHCGQLIRLP
ncbi:MAG TPA: dockerin type I repeat-containing protein [Candidatus Dormibacteraeota bacterium]|nr:dockerin type I repeat-containing protein [Candidatus Dormibacteraeota bacterium]